MSILKVLAVILSVAFLSTGVVGCQKEEGPTEKMGKAVDESAHKTGEAMKESGEDVKKAVE
ncbi:MAG: hypothetical protein LJE91_03805 [Gammaproteobacteria bacterium]|jgi:hypothetical protein|nr:hypothetical protein [Gammaproteobacteria bacterium]